MCEALRPEPHPRNVGEGGEEGLGGRSPQSVVVRPAPPSGALWMAIDGCLTAMMPDAHFKSQQIQGMGVGSKIWWGLV